MAVSIDSQIVVELRSMFKDGATPSRLIRHILIRLENDPQRFGLIQSYFDAAFSAGLVRIANRQDDFSRDNFRYAALNMRLLHQMIAHREEWNDENEQAADEHWFDGLIAIDDPEAIERVQLEAIPELASCLDKLDAKARDYLRRCIGNENTLFERINILARLTERLQQRINALERESAQAEAVNGKPI